MERYRVHVSGSTVELDAKNKLEAANKVMKMSVEQVHISKMLDRYGRFQVAVEIATK